MRQVLGSDRCITDRRNGTGSNKAVSRVPKTAWLSMVRVKVPLIVREGGQGGRGGICFCRLFIIGCTTFVAIYRDSRMTELHLKSIPQHVEEI